MVYHNWRWQISKQSISCSTWLWVLACRYICNGGGGQKGLGFRHGTLRLRVYTIVTAAACNYASCGDTKWGRWRFEKKKSRCEMAKRQRQKDSVSSRGGWGEVGNEEWTMDKKYGRFYLAKTSKTDSETGQTRLTVTGGAVRSQLDMGDVDKLICRGNWEKVWLKSDVDGWMDGWANTMTHMIPPKKWD